jgi:ABC-type phosphate transport system substrate-binding protein
MSHRRSIAAALGVGLAALTLGAARLHGEQLEPPRERGPYQVFQVVVHPRNPLTSVERRFLSQVFLRKTVTWSNGEPIRPVDLPPDTPARRQFTEQIHSRSVAAVKSYWQQVIFSGRGLPPPELATDEAVLRFVARTPGAIGYVSGNADVRAVKVLAVK